MTKPSAAQLERARQLLAREAVSGGSAEACAIAAGRVYDKLDAQLTPLLGATSVQALLVRSAKLAHGEQACLAEAATAESSTRLRACLQPLDPAVAAQAAETLFGTFLALITTFIGERLTAQALRSAWPTLDEAAPTETKK